MNIGYPPSAPSLRHIIISLLDNISQSARRVKASMEYLVTPLLAQLVAMCRPAGMTALVCVSGSHLQCAVFDAEAVVQLLGGLVWKLVSEGCIGNHKMRGERRFGGAHRPDVQVMDTLHTLKLGKAILNSLYIDPFRHSIEGEVH